MGKKSEVGFLLLECLPLFKEKLDLITQFLSMVVAHAGNGSSGNDYSGLGQDP